MNIKSLVYPALVSGFLLPLDAMGEGEACTPSERTNHLMTKGENLTTDYPTSEGWIRNDTRAVWTPLLMLDPRIWELIDRKARKDEGLRTLESLGYEVIEPHTHTALEILSAGRFTDGIRDIKTSHLHFGERIHIRHH